MNFFIFDGFFIFLDQFSDWIVLNLNTPLEVEVRSRQKLIELRAWTMCSVNRIKNYDTLHTITDLPGLVILLMFVLIRLLFQPKSIIFFGYSKII